MANPVPINDALHTAGAVTSAQDARTAQAALVAHDGAGARLGVFYEGNQALITGTATTSPSMTVQVSPLAFAGQKASTEGVYVGRSVGTVTVDVAAAPASNSRIDVVYVMQRDANATTSPDANTQGEIGVITGTAAVSPQLPSIPAGAVEIGTITVPAGATSTTDTTHPVTVTTACKWTAAAGSAIPVRSQAERDAMSAYDGFAVYRLDTHAREWFDGTSWHAGDSTMQNLALTANFGGSFTYQRRSGLVVVAFNVNPTGSAVTDVATIGTIAAGFRPPGNVVAAAVVAGSTAGRVQIATDGTVSVLAPINAGVGQSIAGTAIWPA